MKKIKLFTHTDLDGNGCAILAKCIYRDVDISYCNHENVNKKIRQFISQGQTSKYQKVFITDLTIDDITAGLIDKKSRGKILLFDHHKTNEHIAHYSWATVKEKHKDGRLACGASLFYQHLEEYAFNPTNVQCLRHFVETVRVYDTWTWNYRGDHLPRRLNLLFYMLGGYEFVKRMVNRFSNANYTLLNEDDLTMVKLEEVRIERYIQQRQAQMIVKRFGKYKAGIVFAENYISEVGNAIAENHSELDFVAIINLSNLQVSYRSIKNHIDLGEIASNFGGGGHAKAAGNSISETIPNIIAESIWSQALG